MKKEGICFMQLCFQGNADEIMKGVRILSSQLGYAVSEEGHRVHVESGKDHLQVSGKNGEYLISYGEKAEFFRGLATLVDKIKKGDKDFDIIEKKQFDTCGVMLDVSRNAVLKPDAVKDILRKIALMGLNMAMLYTEDTYKIDGYPYFGYMRGAYTKEELKEMDSYAGIFGIELIPCIQTLAHLTTTLRWQYADCMKDTNDILLIDEPETYRFIDKMIGTVRECYTTKRIHIGMDEAHMVGLGRFLQLHGYENRYDLLLRHLRKVTEITKKYNMEPMMWNDMFFRLASKTNSYYDPQVDISRDIVDRIPDISMVYWDYYNEDIDTYNAMIEKSKTLGREVIFAGGVWAWQSMGINYKKTFAATVPALKACRQQGIKQVFATVWQNECSEVSMYSALLGLQLFAEYNYHENVDASDLRERFQVCTGFDMDAFLLLQTDDFDRDLCHHNTVDVAKQVLFQDILQGLFDKNLESVDLYSFYQGKQKRLSEIAGQGELEYLFQYQRQLIKVLKIKCNLGIAITKAYREQKREELEKQLGILLNLKEEVHNLKELAMQVWYKNNKPFGFDSLDLKLGGVVARIDTAIKRISMYVDHKIDKIEELEEERLMYKGQDVSEKKPLVNANRYAQISRASV